MHFTTHDDDDFIFAKLDCEYGLAKLYLIDLAQLVVVPDEHFVRIILPYQGHDLVSEEQLCDFDTLHVLTFKLAFKWVRHEDAESIARSQSDATCVLIEPKGLE